MAFTIAVSGKGGTGKTTLTGMLINFLVRKGKKPILAVDADANANLNEVLGVEVYQTIGDAREQMKKDVPVGMTKDVWFEMQVQQAVIEQKDYDLIVMGRPEGPGCYCAANSLARRYIDILTDNYKYVVIDNEAGMEHLSRLTTQNVDLLFVVSDPTIRGIRTAGRILEVVRELGLNIKELALVVNRVHGEFDPKMAEVVDKTGLKLAGIVPADDEIAQFDLEGRPTIELPEGTLAVEKANEIFDAWVK
jgi:CO dehydrogenase maturation factor